MTKEPAPSRLDQYISSSKYQDRYFILRSGDNAFHMSNIALSEDRKMIACRLDTLEPDHTLHLYNGRGGKMRYKASLPEAAVLNEVHLYIPDDTTAKLNSAYVVPVDAIKKVEVIGKNKGETIFSYCSGVIGVLAIPATITIIIVIASL